LISPSFTKSAAHLISTHLKTYSTQVIEEWPKESGAQALIIRSKDEINKDFLKRFPNLEIVVTATSGFDHVDLSLAKKTTVKFCYSPEANVASASEITLWHILNFLKKGPYLSSKIWEWRSGFMLGRELEKKKVSLIGLGRIGSSVAKKLQAFDCEVSAYDPYLDPEVFLNAGVKAVSFEQALSDADIVSLHCPLTFKTKRMINSKNLGSMQKHSILVNCARGPLIDEKDLILSLKNKDIFGACLDVFDKEPLSESSELRSLNCVTLSPHVGGYTLEAQNKSALEAAQQVKNWFEQDQPVLNILPPAYKWAKDLED
jgi:D-3-phosphoglycerate dehydrogenase